MSLPVHLHRHAFVLQKDASLQPLCKRPGWLWPPPAGSNVTAPRAGSVTNACVPHTATGSPSGSLRAVRESLGQSDEFLACKAQAVEDRYGIVLFHRAEQGPAGVGAQRLRVPL